jgi:uncharacterized protein YkwD
MNFSRRGFLQSASASLGVALLDRSPFDTSQTDEIQNALNDIRANLLEMVNEERAVAKVPLLKVDELATQVATKHAVEMATDEYASHWGRDGRKPYHRYSFAGGTAATQENVSAADNTWSTKVADLKQDAAYLHVRLYQEKPPYDGHRKAILAPQHTHVGFGLAVDKLRLRMVQLFVAKYLEVEPVPRQAKPNDRIIFKGKMPKEGYYMNLIEVFYEPLPAAPDISWLRQPRSYALPDESRVLRPRVPPPFMYADRQPGVIEMSLDGKFTTPIRLFRKEPGIYTIVTWLRRENETRPFPATEICIEAL